ncbi:Glutathione synthetase [Nosema bombycis CQ1]|uniref:Glutathione synthetase n=1 Tax=Nosema bombycis (strain CQ1 / CVCC 102059) TaxID=578461 RepID=R0M354_NOSB1|nr:Glutathione synthetase [Nosema bombycis CQ1]|eukprot:EOB12434.1 Glutathione synthetase [Nosema bombycis CQ1]
MCFIKGLEVVHIKINDVHFDNNKVYYKDKLISIIYYRWFYNYDHFDEESKILRKQIENSEVINLPSAEFQMINSKGFQKILKNEENLRKYTEKVEKIKKHFGEFREVDCGKGSLCEGRIEGGSKVDGSSNNNEGTYEEPLPNQLPNNNLPLPLTDWILKDNNEGGGHLNKSLNNSSFLMKKFKSPSFPNSFISDHKERNLISELSIFGGFVAVNGEIKYNEEGGYMVRSKDEKSIEGGVCIGAGGLDSICFE